MAFRLTQNWTGVDHYGWKLIFIMIDTCGWICRYSVFNGIQPLAVNWRRKTRFDSVRSATSQARVGNGGTISWQTTLASWRTTSHLSHVSAHMKLAHHSTAVLVVWRDVQRGAWRPLWRWTNQQLFCPVWRSLLNLKITTLLVIFKITTEWLNFFCSLRISFYWCKILSTKNQ